MPANAGRQSAPEGAPARPVSAVEFAALIEGLGPYERTPRLAVAVSGGPDSLALCLLAARWAGARNGSVIALTVDHGLRPDSNAEAVTVGRWLGARGIRHEVLTWRGDKPSSGILAAAREARYSLLSERCRQDRVLHLLLAHHQDDQAETVALRDARGSGAGGLAGMAPVRELPGLRLLRPLLRIPKARLIATLQAQGQPWLDDPSNRAPMFARSSLRGHQALDAASLSGRAARRARDRAWLEREVAGWLVRSARVDPAGYVLMSRSALQEAPDPIARRALQQALATVGGGIYPPRQARFHRLLEALGHETTLPGRTLAGCRILCRRDDVLICREHGAIRDVLRLEPGVWRMWDRRFAVRLMTQTIDLTLTALGEDGWRERRQLLATNEARAVPAALGTSLPAVRQEGRLLMVPHLGLRHRELPAEVRLEVRFQPAHPLAGPAFALA